MSNIKVTVQDANNVLLEVTPVPIQQIAISRGVAGRGIDDVQAIEIDNALYLEFFFTDGTTEIVGPVGTIQYIGASPIVVTGSTISLSTVPVNLGGTGATTASGARTNLGLGTIATQNANAVAITGGSITGITDLAVADGGTGASTAAGAMVNLLPSYTGNANKRLGLDGTATGLEWVTDGGGTVTSVDASGGTTGLSFTGGPITTSGTLTLSGTLDVDNGGTGATTAAGARTNLNAVDQALTLTAGTGLSGGGDLTANRSFSITNTGVTAASYGAASKTLTATVNAQGQLTALADTDIAISNTQISGLGTMSTQNANAVAITGGSITGITDLAIADGGTGASNAADARSNLGLGTAAVLNAGVALGVATLDAGGTVPLSQIPASIQGGVSYQGSWNAATNTPTLTSSVGSKGYYYVVSTSGSTNLNGVTDWLVGDWAIFNGSVWQKIDNTDQVASVNGYTGVVVLTNTDVGAPPTSLTISAGTGLSGGGDLTTNRTLSIANTAVSAGSYGTASAVPTFTVNGQGQLTAASNTTIAIANTQVSGLGTMSTQNANSVAITGGSITGITDLAIADGGTGASTANGALSNLGGIGTITSTDGSIVVTPSGTTVDLAVSAASPASTLLTQVRNTTGATLTKGTVVYISGATGQIATVSKAIATGDATSAQTLGMITSDLANNTNGYVTVFGLLENMDTSAYTDGAQLYLSGTTAGAVTATKPSAPIHLVYVAVVEYAHPTQGKLLVKVQNGYELDEIHDVSIVSPVTGQTLVYNASTDLWVNNTVSLTAGVNGTLPISNGGTGQTTANAALNALLPTQTGNASKYLQTDGTNATWDAISLSTADITGILPTANGGTGLSSFTSGGVVYASSTSALATGSGLVFDGTNVGVGTTINATRRVNILSGTGITPLAAVGPNGYLLIDNAGSGENYYSASSAQIWVRSGTEQMRLTSTGLGIGTSSPGAKLDVNGNVQIKGGGYELFLNSDNTNYYYLQNTGATGSANPKFEFVQGGVGTRLTLDSSGNVGIGTSSPAAKLDTAGTIRSTSQTVPASGTGAELFYDATNAGLRGYNRTGSAYVTLSLNDNIYVDGGSSGNVKINGNLGLGVTPSAWSAYKAIQVGSQTSISDSGSGFGVYSTNAYSASGGWTYITTAASSQYYQYAGTHVWRTAPSGTAGTAISFTQAMTLDASGNFMVGTTTPIGRVTVVGGGVHAQTAVATGAPDSYADGAGLMLSYNGGIGNIRAYSNTAGTGSTSISFTTAGTEVARIDSSGNLLIAQTTTTSPGDGNTTQGTAIQAAGKAYFSSGTGRALTLNRNEDGAVAGFFRSGTQVGSISVTTTATAYNTSSDYRLKNTIAPMTGALAKVAQLKPVTYKWNADGSDGEGFIAHELAEVCPHAVVGEKDAVDEEGNPKYQGIDTSFLVATVVAALQELKAEFDAYKASHP